MFAQSQWLCSHASSLQQDGERLAEMYRRLNQFCPLGCGALAGCAFDIDRGRLAGELGFARPSSNSMHTVGDRDFIVEFQCWASLLMVHLSKLAEDLIIYGSKEFNFVAMSDLYR